MSNYCKQCNKKFTPTPGNVKKGYGLFCSRMCYAKSMEIPLETRFWSKVDKQGPIPKHCPDLGQCWIWCKENGDHYKNKYGNIQQGGGSRKQISTHRLSWEIHNGPTPKGMCVLHKCDNQSCVNPSHLFIGTKKDNWHDCLSKKRANRPTGENHPCATITEEQVKRILHYKSIGKGPTEISKITKIKYWAVYGVWSRSTWKHIE